MSTVQEAVQQTLEEPLRLDIGCGKNKKAGFLGIDQYDFDGVDIVADLRHSSWVATRTAESVRARMELLDGQDKFYRFATGSVDEVHCSHFLEHLTNLDDKWERVNFFNELYRVMKPGAKCQLIFPHWASSRYYGDPTHKEAFSEFGFYYLKREWRLDQNNAPHADISVNPHGYACNFEATWGYGLHPHLLTRNTEYQMHALSFWKEAATDMIATLTACK